MARLNNQIRAKFRLSLLQILSGWQLVENRAMLAPNVGPMQTGRRYLSAVCDVEGTNRKPPYAGLLSATLIYAEKVGFQFLSLRHHFNLSF
jgi:hypothetical protein